MESFSKRIALCYWCLAASIFAAILIITSTVQAAVWVSGSNLIDQAGIYGTKGVPEPNNTPGARGWAVSWIDSSGNLWLFGGYSSYSSGNDTYLNDLWKYEPSSNLWTWVSGSNLVNQAGIYIPGARCRAVSWIDNSGNLWLFGGDGFDTWGARGCLNDLWKYDPSSGLWTLVSGSNIRYQSGSHGDKGIPDPHNVPGARIESVSWIDSSGNLWLFGGEAWNYSLDHTPMNDLWKYEPSSGLWTWVSGAYDGPQRGLYGTKGVPDSDNVPGARQGAISWIDSSGNLWLFGGRGYDISGNCGELNDLWKYEPSSGLWTWVSGSDIANEGGSYGVKGIAGANNVPGARNGAISWKDSTGNLWLFGGHSQDNPGYLNDLWKYEPSSGLWTWVSGSNVINQTGVYGTKGVPDPNNIPGARIGAISWIDSSGNLWLFGGNESRLALNLNDLWKFTCEHSVGDLNGDCKVDFKDFTIFAFGWLENGLETDLSGDGKVDLADLSIFCSHWLEKGRIE